MAFAVVFGVVGLMLAIAILVSSARNKEFKQLVVMMEDMFGPAHQDSSEEEEEEEAAAESIPERSEPESIGERLRRRREQKRAAKILAQME